MISSDVIHEMGAVLSAQRRMLSECGELAQQLEDGPLARSYHHAEEIQDLETELARIERSAHGLPPDAMSGWSTDEVLSAYDERGNQVRRELDILKFTDWKQFTRDSVAYLANKGDENWVAWDAMLTEDDLKKLRAEGTDPALKWDQLDYAFVGTAGILGCLVDIFLVAIPKTLHTGQFAGQKGSSLTEWLHGLKLPDGWQKWLEQAAKVPFDQTGGGNHRIDTLGHCPVLGWIFGVMDILNGTSTTTKAGSLVVELTDKGPVNLIESVIRLFLHLLSDVATSKGLPVPFAPLARLLDFGPFKGPTGKSRTISQLAMWMYHNGYDLRHMITMGTTPATIEIVIRGYLMIRHYCDHGEVPFLLARNPKYRSMLLSAHAIACAGNAGKIALMQGNPLAVNYAEWLALIRYLVPSLKYWIFDRERIRLERLGSISDAAWNDLLSAGDGLLKQSYRSDLQLCVLGESGSHGTRDSLDD